MGGSFGVEFIVKKKRVRLHLVDFHRTLFYDQLDTFDLFIYSEDDVLITVAAAASFLRATAELKAATSSPAEFLKHSVGFVRYEQNFSVPVDDDTRHLVTDVQRVYWEHSTDAVEDALSVTVVGGKRYVTMRKPHQAMYMATREQLQGWKEDPKCRFHEVRDRPHSQGKPHQPSEGTQRVWMSSHMLFGKRHCGVTQVIPADLFGAFNLHHLPDKNFKRLGRKHRMQQTATELMSPKQVDHWLREQGLISTSGTKGGFNFVVTDARN